MLRSIPNWVRQAIIEGIHYLFIDGELKALRSGFFDNDKRAGILRVHVIIDSEFEIIIKNCIFNGDSVQLFNSNFTYLTSDL